jgi:type VI secretion system secreted protein VgrG
MGATHTFGAGEYRSGELHLLSFEGREEMNGLYSFEVVFWAREADDSLLERSLLAAPASLGMNVPGFDTRYLHGIIAAVTPQERAIDGRHSYRVNLVPRLWLLGKRVNSRIFQDLTVSAIIDVVLEEHGIERDWDLSRDYTERQYCVQYQESDLQFVSRLCAEEGIFFSFTHAGNDTPIPRERLLFGDDAAAYPPIDGDPEMVERRQSGESAIEAAENQVNGFHLRTRIEPTAAVIRDYDFQRPLLDLTSDAAADETEAPLFPFARSLENYDHHGEYEETDVNQENASIHLEQMRTGTREASGASACRRLLPGRTFDLAEHEADALNRAWVVTHVDHRGVATEAAKAGQRVYENRFRCIPAEIPNRPPRPARITRQVIESAVVVGPEGQDIFTDPYGRIKVQFHWDREGTRDAFSSCWMRVMQPWAGTGFGFQFIPRIGMEVVVSFLGGDLDRPVVLGCLYNATNPVPHLLPGQSTRSGIRTNSTPGGGGSNEIAFDDRSGSEQLFVHAQRNLDQEVGQDRSEKVARDTLEAIGRDARTEVTQHRYDATGGDHRVVVNGGRSVAIASRDDLDVRGPRSTAIGAGDRLSVAGLAQTQIAGDRITGVSGSDRLAIKGDCSIVIDGEVASDVLGPSRLSFSDALAVNAGGGITLSVGTKGAPASASASLAGDLALKGSGALQLSSDSRIELRVGSTVLTLLPNELRFESEKITLDGKSIEASGEEGSLSVGKDVTMKGGSVKLASKDDAILELDKEARLDGKTVKIKPGLAAEMAKQEEREEQAKDLGTNSVALFDLAGDPIPNAPYEVSFFGYLDEGVSGAGTVDIPAFPDVEIAHVRWGRPKDKREDPDDPAPYEWEMDVYLKTDSDEPHETLRRKLHNLGHQHTELSSAIRHYQDTLGVDRTGLSDDVKPEIDTRHDAAAPAKLALA